jgi:hypothetical protein
MIKYLIGVAMCLLYLSNVHAQLQKGEIMIGPAFQVETRADDFGAANQKYDAKVFTVSLPVTMGFGNNWMAGVSAGYSYSRDNYEQLGSRYEFIRRALPVSVFVRKAFPFTERLGVYGQGNVAYSRGSNKQYQSNTVPNPVVQDFNEYGVFVQPGLYFRPSKKFVIDASIGTIGYTGGSYKNNAGLKTTISLVNFSLTSMMTVSMRYVINSKTAK